MRGTPPVVAALIILILVQLVVARSLNLYPQLTMIDFFQYWGVSNARRLSAEVLGTPYTDGLQYRAVLIDYATRAGHPRLKPPGFTATPFAYTLFAMLPENYARAALLYHALQILLFLGALVLVGGIYGYPLFTLLCLALLLAIGSGPLSSDLRLGNIGAFQLFSLALILALHERLRQASRAVLPASVLLTGLTVLTLAKPNVALVGVALALHLWVAHGARVLALAAVPAGVSGAAALVIPCLYFHSWDVWQQWYGVVLGKNPRGLALKPAAGNYATARLFSLLLEIDVWTVSMLIAAALVVSMVVVIAASGKAADARTRETAHRGVLARAFGDVHLALAIGVTATIALPPLVWYHYYVILLIPGLWMLSPSWGCGYGALCGLAAVVLSSGPLDVLFIPLGWGTATAYGAALSWLPLWGGILLRLHLAGPRERAGTSRLSTDDQPPEARPAAVEEARDLRPSRKASRREAKGRRSP
jgi:hypothetical protein